LLDYFASHIKYFIGVIFNEFTTVHNIIKYLHNYIFLSNSIKKCLCGSLLWSWNVHINKLLFSRGRSSETNCKG